MLTKTKKVLEWCILSFLGLLLILASILFGYQQAYAGKIYKNVYVADIDLSGKTKKQAEALLVKKFNSIVSSEITLSTEGKEVKAKIADTGLTLDVGKIIKDSYQVGRSEKFINQLFYSAKTLWNHRNIKVEAQIDQDKFKKFIEIAVGQLNSNPENAQIVIEGGQIKETPEKEGLSVDTTNLSERILALINDRAPKTIQLSAQKTAPQVKLANFEEAKSQAESILNKKVIFSYDNKTYSPSRVEIGLWISFANNNGKYSATLNDSNIQAYLNRIAKNFEITKQDKKINAANGQVLEEGREGKYLDKNNSLAQLKGQINSNNQITVNMQTYTVAPAELKVFPAEGIIPGRFEGKYIDVDLRSQKLCRIDGPNIIDCFQISSGKASMPTPKGTFHITNKSPRQYSSKYALYMPWWQQFSGDYGIHELPETNTWKEVPDHLGTPVSHGCVRLGVGPAKTVYDWTDIGTTVYIH